MALNPQQASTNELVQVKQIKGLVPALDDKEVGQPFVISGRNFAVDYEGPYAAFAHVFGSYDPIQNPIAIETIQIGNAVFYCTQNAIYTYDSIGMWFVPVYQFTPVTDAWPWSVAYVGSKYYLCREGVGVLQYDPVAISFQNINTMTFTYQGTPGQAVSAFLPVNPCAICQSYGRLVILGSDKVVWSAQDNGIYIGVDLTTGSAYQGLSIIGGSPLNVKETIDGFVTFTTNGILKSEINNGVTVYNHFVLSRTAKMLNPFCCVTMPNAIGTTTSPFLSSSDMIITFLTKQGFYTTDGHVPRPWEPLFSEFLTKKILPNYKDLTVTSLFRLLYVEDRRWLFLSVADPDFQQKYQKAYVLYTPRDEWGSFNELHCAIGLFNVGLSPQQNYNLGYIDWNGYIHTFQDLAYKEMTFDSFHNYLYRVKTEAQCRYIENGVLLASTQMRMAITDESKFGNKIS